MDNETKMRIKASKALREYNMRGRGLCDTE